MAVTVKRITIWRAEVPDGVGILARALQPLAKAGVDLKLAMAYRIPGQSGLAVVEAAPIVGKRAAAAARQAGLAPTSLPTLHVEGENRAGVGHAIANAVASAGISMSFLMAEVVGRRFATIIGFSSADDARKAARLIKKAASAKK